MEDITFMYKEIILDLNRNPLNKRIIQNADATHTEFNPACGDEIQIQVVRNGNIVSDIAHQGHGCAISQAAVSLLTDHAKGMSVDGIQQMNDDSVYELLGFTPIYTRRKCATIGLTALHKAMEHMHYEKRK